MFFTDGLVEEHKISGEEFGEQRLINTTELIGPVTTGVSHMVRSLSHTLMRERGGSTSDDATLFLLEWRGEPVEHLVRLDF
jgi:serine phosphatase RsbU (regulator of sigma subunit)